MRARTIVMRAASALVLAAVSCTVPALELAGKACPCTSDFECDLSTNTCVAPGTVSPDGGGASDGAGAEGATRDDGSLGDAHAGDSGAQTFCGAHAGMTFCDDFDDDDASAAPWGFSDYANATTSLLGIDNAKAVSGHSAYFEVKEENANSGYATLSKRFGAALTTASKIDIDLDLLVEKIDAEVPVVEILVSGIPGDYEVYLGLQKGNARIQGMTTPAGGGAVMFEPKNLTAPVTATSGWVHVHWGLQSSTTETNSDVTITGAGGATLSTGAMKLSLYKFLGVPQVRVGIPYVNGLPTVGWRFRVDNVLVDIR